MTQTGTGPAQLTQEETIEAVGGKYQYGWHDTDIAGQSAKRGLNEDVVRDISAKRLSRSGC